MNLRLLVIEDETNIRRMIRLTLESDGHEVEDAPDGEAGLQVFGDGSNFDAVVLDQKMPKMDGLETLRQIRGRSPGMPVVMVTAFGSIELAVDAMKAGATDFLKKPLTPDLLRGAVLAAVSKRAPRAARQPAAMPLEPSDVWTVNGFFIRALPVEDASAANMHRFSVRHAGKGPHGDVAVALSDLEMSRIARLAGRRLPLSRAFWQKQAERALMNYLFREAALPPNNRLAIDQLSDDAVLVARDWKDA